MQSLNWSDWLLNPYVWLLTYSVLVNIAAFFLYGLDKLKAKRNLMRVSEFTLLMIAIMGGSLGALIGMNVRRHKTKHWNFTIGVPIILILQIALAVWIGIRF